MKKTAFALYVFAIIIMVPLSIVLELGSVAKKTPETKTPVSVIEKAEEKPMKAFVKDEIQKNYQLFVNSFPLTVNTNKL